MGDPVFVVEDVSLRAGDTVVLDGPEGHHAATVQRLRVGEHVVVTDGRGTSSRGTVVAAARDRLDVRLSDLATTPPPQPRFVVVQALAKGDRGELAVAMLTEVGADAVVPWSAARCVVRWDGARAGKALARWRATARESAKQSRRAHLPEIADLASTADVIALLGPSALALVLHEEATTPLSAVALPTSGDVVLVVGPEGGLAPDEVAAFAAAGATVCRLGPTVLRTSTAGPAALAALLSRTARWA